ncbi:MAG: DUF2336 domain-containing protein [Alphaproteobacteria bacterium]|nr:DUF2336 domain-containing protein [Alphaproteobacteria bacterium]
MGYENKNRDVKESYKESYKELTLGLLQKSPAVGNLLVRLHDKHILYGLAKHPEDHARIELADIMAELLTLDLTPSENELITDVLSSLVKQAETTLRQAVAERISTIDDAPLRLVLQLANDEITVAKPVLEKSKALTDLDLTYIVKARKTDHWQSIAKRVKMSKELIDCLADTRDYKTAITLCENKNVRLTGYSMNIFSDMAEVHDPLAKPLLMRKELPNSLASKLYSFVGQELKSFIKENYSIEESKLFDDTVGDIIFEISASRRGEYTPNVKMIIAAERLLERGLLNADVMVENLRRGQVSSFIAMFSVYCGLPVGTVEEMLGQKTAQGLAIACKATNIPKSEFVNMFLLTSRVRGAQIIDKKDLARALAYYDRIKEPLARRILNQSRH